MSSLQISRTFAAPPDRVWQAFTDPKALAAWFWPKRLNTSAEIDLRPGGRYRIMGSGMAVSGEYVSVEVPTRLVFTWRWDGEDAETLVTLELSAAGDGTDVVLIHDQFVDEPTRDEHAQGWSDCLDRLPAWLAA